MVFLHIHIFIHVFLFWQNEVGAKDLLGAQPADVLRDAVEEVISILKDENLRDPERHYEISKLLTGKPPGAGGAVSNERYAQFVSWSKKLTDYHRVDEDAAAAAKEDEGINEEGVAVVFDESEEERSEGDEDASDVGDEVVDVASSEEEDEEAEGAAAADVVTRSKEQQDVEGDHQQRITLGGNRRAGEEKQQQDDDNNNIIIPEGKKGAALSVHEIDAHWLQRQLSTHFSEDVDVCAKIADDVLNVLELRDVRECENKLLVLLGFDLFEFIKVLLSHRLLIWACIKLKRAKDDEEKQAIEEVVKRSDPSVWNDLYSKASVENWTQDRMSRAARETKNEARQLNIAGDTTNIRREVAEDDDVRWKEQQDVLNKDKDAATELDLDSLAFRDGGHLMSNKKCELPDGSWRAMRKGYEEVHVPAVRSIISKDEKLISITELPAWTHAAFEGMDKLNRVQSKMCEAALYSSENILLCAPTGAGKLSRL